MIAAYRQLVWRWTINRTTYGGMKDTLEEAQQRFKKTFVISRRRCQ